MKKNLLFLLVSVLMAVPSLGATTYRYQDVVQTIRGDAVGTASVAVYEANTSTIVTLYSGPTTAHSELSNPTYSDSYGRFYFYAATGTYDVVISGDNITSYTVEDVTLGFPWEQIGVMAVTSSGVEVPGVNAPDEIPYKTSLSALSFAVGDYVYLQGVQLPHEYSSGTDIDFRVGFINDTNVADADTVRWELVYAISNPYDPSTGAEQTIYCTFINNAETRAKIDSSCLSGTTILAESHLVADYYGDIDGTDLVGSSVIYGRIRMQAASYIGECLYMSADFHYQVDDFGSIIGFGD